MRVEGKKTGKKKKKRKEKWFKGMQIENEMDNTGIYSEPSS